MYKTPAMPMKKILGCLLVIFCMPLLIFSIIEYLFTSYPCVESIERPYVRHVYLQEEESFHVSYSISEAEIYVNQSLQVQVEVTGDEVIDFYIMSNSQYEDWKNGSVARGILELPEVNHEDLVFIPSAEDRYYLVLDNTSYNASKSIRFQSVWIVFVHLVNYGEAFWWLKIALVNLVLLLIGSFLSNNPINLALKKLQGFALLKEIRNVKGQENIDASIKASLKFFWLTLGILTAIAFVGIVRAFANSYYGLQIFPELFPIVTDILIRLFLYYYSVFIWMSLFLLFWMWLFDFIDGLDVLYFVRVKKLQWNPELRLKAFQNMRKELLSLKHAVYYIFASVLLIVGCFLMEFRFPLLIGSIFVFSVVASQAAFRSFRKSCSELDMKWTEELKHDMPFAVNGVLIAVFCIPLFLLILRSTIPAVLDVSDMIIIKSFSGLRFKEYFYAEIDPRKSIFGLIGAVTADIILFSSLLFLFVIIMNYYILPQMHTKLTVRSKLKSLVTPAIAAFLAFATNEIYYVWMTPASAVRKEWSIIVSLIAFGTSYFAGRAYEEAMK